MEADNTFLENLDSLISAIENGAGKENNLIEVAVGEIKIKGISYQIQLSLVKKELWINQDLVSASFVFRNDTLLN